ncbi:MAG TPA: polysaccharide deacetylase family protein [Rhizomicrobium sp.]|nr:polysaccharide deacetylase family protein [Rhizomicrobium sp.]
MANGFGSTLRSLGSLLPAALLRPFGRPAALFFHGVERRIVSPAQANHHDLEAFTAIARQLRDEFEVLPLAELSGVLKAPERHRRAVFLMSDDGYANLLSEAAPVLREFHLPWSVFVSTHHIDTGEHNPAFVARLFALFAKDGEYDVPALGRVVLGAGRERAAEIYGIKLKAIDAARAGEAVAAMRAALGEDRLAALFARFASDKFLTWPELRALQAQGVEVGAHAHRHWPMHGAQNSDTIIEQARASRARIEAEIGPCRYFAYPHGNVSDVCRAAWQAVRDAGYDYGFTTLSGSLDAGSNPWLLPRYGLQPRETRLGALVPILRAGNKRLRDWQQSLS